VDAHGSARDHPGPLGHRGRARPHRVDAHGWSRDPPGPLDGYQTRCSAKCVRRASISAGPCPAAGGGSSTGYAERVTDEGDGRSAWWVGRDARAEETLEAGRGGLRQDLEHIAAQLPKADRLAVLRALLLIEGAVARHAHIRCESRWRETQYRRWQERQRERW
jgi:hypothetical protein